MTGCSGKCRFGVLYCEWYGVCVCDFVVLVVVEVCADYGGVNMFHVCLNFGVVYGVGVCVNVCGVVCVVGQVGLGVGSWPSNRETEGSNPKGTRLCFVILLKNLEKIFDWY